MSTGTDPVVRSICSTQHVDVFDTHRLQPNLPITDTQYKVTWIFQQGALSHFFPENLHVLWKFIKCSHDNIKVQQATVM